MTNEKQILSPEDIAHRWAVDAKTVRTMLNNGELLGFRAGARSWRVRREILEEYELCQNSNGGSQGLSENGVSLGTSQTEPDADTGSEPPTDAKPRRKPRLDTRNSHALRVVQ